MCSIIEFKGADIAPIAPMGVGNELFVQGAMVTALISVNSETLALINRWTAGQKGMSDCRPAVHLQWANERINRQRDAPDKIRVDVVGEARASICLSN